jgi:hypothetical protein
LPGHISHERQDPKPAPRGFILAIPTAALNGENLSMPSSKNLMALGFYAITEQPTFAGRLATLVELPMRVHAAIELK